MRLHRNRRRLQRLIGLAGAALATGCPFPGPGQGPGGEPLDPPPPLLVDFALTCDLDAERWTLEAEADSWSGGGELSWSADLEYVERHFVRSVRAAPDGTSDSLRSVLPIVGDWREATPGVSTAMRCGQDPSFVFVVFDRDGEVSDCEAGGPDPEGLGALPGIPTCP